MTYPRRKLIAGNWKLNLNSEESRILSKALIDAAGEVEHEVVVFPTFLCAASVARNVAGSKVGVGVQDIYPAEWGAFTGEISPVACHAEGLIWALAGHSERRALIGETDKLIARKASYALQHGMKIIYCIGETFEERESGRTFEVLEHQVIDGALVASPSLADDFSIAYEPVWAIGTGRTATPEIAQEAHAFIRKLLVDGAGSEAATKTRILYGGSVKASNIDGLMAMADLDGVLVGGASLKAEEFVRVIRFKES